MKDKFAENAFQVLHNFLVEHNMTYLYLIIIGLSGLLFFLGWLIATEKSKMEIKKLRNECEKIRVYDKIPKL
jgi:hypothetical protein